MVTEMGSEWELHLGSEWELHLGSEWETATEMGSAKPRKLGFE